MISDLFVNVTIVLSFLFVSGQILKNYPLGRILTKIKVKIGILFGLLGIILMLFTIQITDTIIVDLRNIAIICSGIFGGPLSVLISAFLIAVFRLGFFGTCTASVIGFTGAIFIGIGCSFISNKKIRYRNKFLYMILFSTFLSSVALAYLLISSSKLIMTLLFFWLVHIFAGFLTYFACNYIIQNNKTFRELSYYQIMADNLMDVITTHKPDGMLIYASPTLKKLVQYNPEEIILMNPCEWIHKDDLAGVKKIFESLIDNSLQEYTQELRIRNKEGDYLWVESSFRSYSNSEGNNIEVVCVTRDISNWKLTEEELKKQKAQVMEAYRLKNEFLANISHELRTPLNAIIGFTTRVIRKSTELLPKSQQDNLLIVKKEAQHLLELINDLIEYSKIEAGKMNVKLEYFCIEELIDEAFSATKHFIYDKNIKFKKDIFLDNKTVMKSDRKKVKQIIMNLLSNAFKYSEKGTVQIVTEYLTKDEYSTFLKVSVSDEGIGIQEENLSYIFDEFRQLDGSCSRRADGTGLGLALTKKFVGMLGGSIEVDSELGAGSVFTVYLPVVVDESI